MGPDGKDLGEIASVVLFENEKVKIWNLIVEPGEASDWTPSTVTAPPV